MLGTYIHIHHSSYVPVNACFPVDSLRRNISTQLNINFKGTCRVGQVNFSFYLPDTILNCPAKGVTFLYLLYLYQLTVFLLSVVLKKILNFLCVIVSLKLHDEILPARAGTL